MQEVKITRALYNIKINNNIDILSNKMFINDHNTKYNINLLYSERNMRIKIHYTVYIYNNIVIISIFISQLYYIIVF